MDAVEDHKAMVKVGIAKVEQKKKDIEEIKQGILEENRIMEVLKGLIEDVKVRNKLEKGKTRVVRMVVVNSFQYKLEVEEEYEEGKKRKLKEKYRKVVELADQATGEYEELLGPVVELVEEMEGVLRKVHEPPSLVDLAARRVVEERMEVEGRVC